MKLPHRWAVKLSPLVEAARGEPLVEPGFALEVADAHTLVLRSGHGHFAFDLGARRVLRDGEPVADFDAIRSVDIGSLPGGLGERTWSLTLYLGVVRRIALGRTYDDGDASVVAARLASAIGCKVISLHLRP
jgi:hypothetical protein